MAISNGTDGKVLRPAKLCKRVDASSLLLTARVRAAEVTR